MLAPAQVDVNEVKLRGEPLSLQNVPLRGKPRSVRPSERLLAPQPQSLRQQGRAKLVTNRAGLVKQRPKAMHVHRGRRHGQHVPARLPADLPTATSTQRPPQPGDVHVQGVPRLHRRMVEPHPVNELVNRNRTVHVHQQTGKHAALPKMPDIDLLTVDADLDVAKQPEHRGHGDHPQPPSSRRPS